MLSENILAMASKGVMIVLSFYATWLFQRLVIKSFNSWIKKQPETEQIDQTIASFIKIIFKIVLWILVVLFVLQNLGLQITALLGGLGVAGLAVAFAFQRILEDVFSFFLIYFDKPFKVGDYISVGPDSGTVKNIGVRTTKLTMPGGQELLISNRELTNARLQNFKQMKKRHVVFNFSLTYETSPTQLEKVKQIVITSFKNLNSEIVALDRVHFKSLGETGLIFEVAYDVLSKDYVDYMDLQEKINLTLLKNFVKEKISFVFPSQATFLHQAHKKP